MAYYLQMDGVDDYLSIPSIPHTKIRIHFKLGSKLGYFYSERHANGGYVNVNSVSSTYFTSLTMSDVNGNPINNIPRGIETTIDVKFSAISTNTIHLFARVANTSHIDGELYSLEVYNSEILMARYDMTNGTVQDQSGNGNHATLFGGTWVEDGQGGTGEPEPTPISLQIPTRQTIYRKQLNNHSTKQVVFKQANINGHTKQLIYKQTNVSFSTQQIITVSLTGYTAKFATKQIIYKQSHLRHPTQQIIFKRTSSDFKTAQQIFKQVLNNATIKQVIYKQISENNPIQIRVTIPGAPELVGIIHLRGKRELVVSLHGKRELTVYLEGRLNMVSNQNFNMVSGDTKTIIININEDLSGANVRWALFKRGEATEALIKSGNVIDGQINITLNKDDTEGLKGLYSHECEVTDQNGNVSTVTTGTVTIINDIA